MWKQAASFATVIVVSMIGPASIGAQTPPPATVDGPVSFSLLGGLSTGAGDTGGGIGGTVAVNLGERFALEGRGVFFDRGAGADGFEVNASLLVNLATGRRANPYLAVGGGVYRASFDLGHQRFFGMMGLGSVPGAQLVPIRGTSGWGVMPGPGMTGGWPNTTNWGPGWMMGSFNWSGTAWSGPTFDVRQMPTFYAGRMGAISVPADGRWERRAFTDPALSLGGGVRLDITEKVYVSPDARALLVVGDGDTYTIGTFSVSLGYRF